MTHTRPSLYLSLLVLLSQAAWAAPQSLPTISQAKNAEQLILDRQLLDQDLWQPEVEAQRHEAIFTTLWDNLLKAQDKFKVLAGFPFTTLKIGTTESSEDLDLQIKRTKFGIGTLSLSSEKWYELLRKYRSAGYRIEHTEWHHSSFTPPIDDQAAKSKVSMTIHAYNPKDSHRVIIRGHLDVDWSTVKDKSGMPTPETITINDMEILERHAPPAFQEVFRVNGTSENPLVLPLHVYDLNGDGLSEIIVGGQNMLIQNKGKGKFEAKTLLPGNPALYDAAILADFTGDGQTDYIAIDQKGYPLLFERDSNGAFTQEGRQVANAHFKHPKSFTAGDIDGDGDLDLFIANYKYAYRQGQWPTPYFDANDGFPAYLLQNDGKGNFTDITEQAGLATKRFRRTYSSSLVDLDDDLDMDLVVVSDYAGMDMYLNDGKGNFTDISNDFGGNRHFFGMGHTFADYNLDGKLDLFVIGMSSTTARRLENMGLERPDKPEFNQMRQKMGYGNRMFLRDGDRFSEAPFNDQVAHTGWSWGASSFDFDNDGDKDIFIANGHYSGKSTKDYCTTFWRHDIYTEGSKPDFEQDKLFQSVSSSLRQADISWNGYEHKVLYLNNKGTDFINIAYLMGAAFEYDGRAVVTDDLDGDGRVDLLTVEFKTQGLDNNSYTVHVYRNQLEAAGHWVGVHLQAGPGFSPIGATIKLISERGTQMTRLVTGDSFSSQHPASAHFGLGRLQKIESLEIQWPNGIVQHIKKPEIDQYHEIKSPPSH